VANVCVGVRAFVPVREASTTRRWFDSVMKAASAAIVITTAALVVLAVQRFGGSNSEPVIPSATTSLGVVGHNYPFQIGVAALHAAAHVLPTVGPEARHAPALESSRSYQRRGAGSMGSMGKAVGSAILRYLVLVITSLDRL
jgi:hypothetical protein